MAKKDDDHREKMAEESRRKSHERRDIGTIPNIANVRRRSSCRDDLRKFCETYNRHAIYRNWSQSHLKAIARIEEAIKLGALYAFAMPRGSGKSVICRMASLWAVSYHHVRYLFLIGATDDKAKDSLASIRTMMRFSPEYAADFPEISYPAIRLEGIANRAGAQISNSEPTLIEWSVDGITLPTVAPPKNWPKSWKLRSDGKVPTSGSVIAVSGLTGDGIRGSLRTLTTGEMIRPDFFLLDDPQTSESAGSKAQNETRIKIVSADLLGMAGPGESISGVMPCTVIEQGDMADVILDRSKHPIWRGERTKMLVTMPKNMDKWKDYFEVYKQCALSEPPDFTAANEYYETNRVVLDEGASADWEDRKKESEVSAIQHAMNLYCRDPISFFSEYQNDPLAYEESGGLPKITAAGVAARTTGIPRGVVPRTCSRVTAFIDIGGQILWYAVVGWDEHFGGSIIDYGTYPRQNQAYFAKSEPSPSLESLEPGMDVDGRVFNGLEKLAGLVINRDYEREGGGTLKIERCLIDSSWKPDIVHEFVKRTANSGILLPSIGVGIGAKNNPMSHWPMKQGERVGWNYRIPPRTQSDRGKHCKFDTNAWKTFAVERFLTPFGSKGSLKLFGEETTDHRLFGAHCVSEFRVRTSGRERTVDEWDLKPNCDNDWWDCVVGAAVAAGTTGLNYKAPSIPGQTSTTTNKPAVSIKLSDLQRMRREGKQSLRA